MAPGSGPPTGVKVLVATKPVDFRRGMDGLARAVKEGLKADPHSGVIYVFQARRADRIKLLYWDGSGLVLYAKRLEQGRLPLAADHRRHAAEHGAALGTRRSPEVCPGQRSGRPSLSPLPGSTRQPGRAVARKST